LFCFNGEVFGLVNTIGFILRASLIPRVYVKGGWNLGRMHGIQKKCESIFHFLILKNQKLKKISIQRQGQSSL